MQIAYYSSFWNRVGSKLQQGKYVAVENKHFNMEIPFHEFRIFLSIHCWNEYEINSNSENSFISISVRVFRREFLLCTLNALQIINSVMCVNSLQTETNTFFENILIWIQLNGGQDGGGGRHFCIQIESREFFLCILSSHWIVCVFEWSECR